MLLLQNSCLAIPDPGLHFILTLPIAFEAATLLTLPAHTRYLV